MHWTDVVLIVCSSAAGLLAMYMTQRVFRAKDGNGRRALYLTFAGFALLLFTIAAHGFVWSLFPQYLEAWRDFLIAPVALCLASMVWVVQTAIFTPKYTIDKRANRDIMKTD